ncbi:hypothetical protein P7K49_035629 [Saguinus oedipus]|uniref:Uncharacterized protein n=1 Tax=Saguinus oedipus TaxID=9490 RepID=A0ABQ9TN55_SAGOE|nr:hypothetical protein P7K49_035629 [Saguinus oedipus]
MIASQAGATLNNLMSHAQELVAKLRSLQFDQREFTLLLSLKSPESETCYVFMSAQPSASLVLEENEDFVDWSEARGCVERGLQQYSPLRDETMFPKRWAVVASGDDSTGPDRKATTSSMSSRLSPDPHLQRSNGHNSRTKVIEDFEDRSFLFDGKYYSEATSKLGVCPPMRVKDFTVHSLFTLAARFLLPRQGCSNHAVEGGNRDELLRKEVHGGTGDIRVLPSLITSGRAWKYCRHSFGEENAKGLQKEATSAHFSRRGTATC